MQRDAWWAARVACEGVGTVAARPVEWRLDPCHVSASGAPSHPRRLMLQAGLAEAMLAREEQGERLRASEAARAELQTRLRAAEQKLDEQACSRQVE